jgi:uncharacterized hydrophobic protein (TIGR00271 family)
VERLSEGVDRDRVFAEICDAGAASGRYVMMSVLSAAIATLGLLLSSPAVVIGAMLISPLMSPIILLGLSFWTLDWPSTRRAALSLLIGLGVALAVAVILTWASPLKEPTAEILARTRPNLFDLLVAAFSGIAGGYATIRQRGETVIGVAIATALMPPIATVGFGLGTTNWPVALGALLLFATNLVAIALAAAGMAALYGFRQHRAGGGWWGQAAVIVVVGALCVPLTLSLNTIALESRATLGARDAIHRIFGRKARITSLSVRDEGARLQVEGLIATPTYVSGASAKIAQRLRSDLGAVADVGLDQVVLADPAKYAATAEPSPPPPDPVATAIQTLRAAVPFQTKAIAYDPVLRRGVVVVGAASGLDLEGSMMLEQGLRSRPGLEATEVIPYLQPLPPVDVSFEGHAARLGKQSVVDFWALRRWGAQAADTRVCGVSARSRRREIETASTDAAKPLSLKASKRLECPGGGGAQIVLAPG